MGIRDIMKNQPIVGIGVSVLLIGAGAVLLFSQTRPPAAEKRPLAFYSNDDGKTTFTAEVGRIVPYDYQGKEAVRAYVFEAAAGGEAGAGARMIGFLEKYSPELKAKLLEAKGDHLKEGAVFASSGSEGILVKRPGEQEWVNGEDPRAAVIRQVSAPDGGKVRAVLAGEQ